MPFKRSKTYTDRVGAASKVGLLFSKRHLETLPWPWRIVIRGIGWIVMLIVIAMVLFPVVMVVAWLVGQVFRSQKPPRLPDRKRAAAEEKIELSVRQALLA